MLSIDLSNPCAEEKAAVEKTSKPIVVEMDGKYWSHYVVLYRYLIHW